MKKLAIACAALIAFAPGQAAFAGSLVDPSVEEEPAVDPFPAVSGPSLSPLAVAGLLIGVIALVAADDT